MVGEIRDLDTVTIAIQASLTGHMVFSTLHTNTAVGAITRLRDMGVEPFLLSSSIVGILAQRLVRTLCRHCKQAYEPTEPELKVLGLPASPVPTLYRAVGCDACNQLGYRGRTGIYELINVDNVMREMIHNGDGEQAMEARARITRPSLYEDGLRRILNGDTSVEEVLRVTQEN